MKKDSILTFEQFSHVVAILQNINNPKDTKFMLKDLYGKYASAPPEERENWNSMAITKTKAGFISIIPLYEED